MHDPVENRDGHIGEFRPDPKNARKHTIKTPDNSNTVWQPAPT